MKYLLIIDGTGEGCDYTVGCNTTVVEFEIRVTSDKNDKEELLETLYRLWDEMDGEEAHRWSNVRLVQVVDCVREGGVIHYLPPVMDFVRAWRMDAESRLTSFERDETEADERAELARLQQKYGRV